MTYFKYLKLALVLLALQAGCAHYNVTDRAVIKPVPEPAGSVSSAQAFAGLAVTPEVLSIAREQGVSLHAVWLAQPNATHTVLYFGGNMTRVNSGGPEVAKHLLPFGVNLFLVDHRGSGLSTGTPGIENLHADALAAYDYLIAQKHIAPTRIIVQGHSLGSFLAGHVAHKREVAALVLSGSATTTEDWISAQIPWYYKPFVRTKIAPEMQQRGNLNVVKKLTVPLLLIVGEKDRQTPKVLSKALAQAARDAGHPATLVIVKGASHDQAAGSKVALEAFGTLLSQLRTR
jgi:uncharacterized protein